MTSYTGTTGQAATWCERGVASKIGLEGEADAHLGEEPNTNEHLVDEGEPHAVDNGHRQEEDSEADGTREDP